MKIKQLDHLVITTQHFEQCVHFYVTVLGMELDNHNNRYAFKFGNQKINVHRMKAEFLPAARQVTYGSQDICLIVEDDIEKVKSELQEKGITIELGIVRRTGACGQLDSLYVRDPDGNLIEISCYVK